MRPSSRSIGLLPIALAAWAITTACGPKHTSTAVHSGQSLVVLLPDGETGKTGRAVVTNESGSVELARAGDATFAKAKRKPESVRTLSDNDIEAIFGGALAALPPPLGHFTLFFKFDSDELTDESLALLPDVINTVHQRSAPDVAIVGHTDTAGLPPANYQLGMKRSVAVRTLLVADGLDSSLVEVTSHGEADPLIPTPDETAEPRNRRVEISVR